MIVNIHFEEEEEKTNYQMLIDFPKFCLQSKAISYWLIDRYKKSTISH
jgi:hypothetical protein